MIDDQSKRQEPKSVSVHVHYHLGRGAYLGNYDFWTLMLRHPIAKDVTISLVSYYAGKALDAIARKAYALLKRAKTPGKRVDVIIPVEDRTAVITRIIGYPPLGKLSEGIPNLDEVREALTYAMRELRKKYKNHPKKFLVTEAMVRKKEAQMTVQISIRLESQLGAALEEQIARARSERPVSLRLEKPKVTRKRRSRRRKPEQLTR